MTDKELKETLERRHSKIDDPNFKPQPYMSQATKIIILINVGVIIAIVLVTIFTKYFIL